MQHPEISDAKLREQFEVFRSSAIVVWQLKADKEEALIYLEAHSALVSKMIADLAASLIWERMNGE